MDIAMRPKQSRLSRTFSKVINLRTATSRIASSNGICLLALNGKFKDNLDRRKDDKKEEEFRVRNRAVMEALLAKLFVGITSIKVAYAELQMAQDPYNNEAIQTANQSVVNELKSISELKRSFLKKELDLSPQVTLMLAEIQEQQAMMKTYEITIKKLESESEKKDSDISSLQKKLQDLVLSNKCSEKRLNDSGSSSLSIFDNLRHSELNSTHFVRFLYTSSCTEDVWCGPRIGFLAETAGLEDCVVAKRNVSGVAYNNFSALAEKLRSDYESGHA